MTNMLQKIDAQEKFYEILLIDKNEHFEYICANFEMLANENSFNENAIKFGDAVKSYNSSRVTFKQGKLTNVLADQNQAEITCPDGKVENVPYDALVIASGATYVSPWRGQDKCLSMAEREQEVKGIRDEMKAATSILCVGAGPTGLETAGYLKEFYPDKVVGICQRGPKLLPAFGNAHDILMESFKKIGVEVHLGKGFSDDDKMGYDYIVDCRGFKYLGPKDFLQGPLADCVEPKTGQIMVDIKGRVTNKHPIASNHHPAKVTVYKNIFSFGDVCLTPANEIKSIVSMFQYGFQVANNVAQTVNEGASFMDIPMEFHKINALPLGKKNGFMAFNKMAMADAGVYEQKISLRNRFMGVFRNEQKWKDIDEAEAKKFGNIMGMASGCCVCLPMHVKKIRAENATNFQKSKVMFEGQYGR